MVPRPRDPGECCVEGLAPAGLRGVVAGQARHAAGEIRMLQGFQQHFQRRAAQRGLRAGEEIALHRERCEGEPVARGVGAQAEAGVGAPRGDRLGDRWLLVLGRLVGYF